MLPQYCVYLRIVSLRTEFKDGQVKEIWVRLGKGGVCLLKTGSKHKFPSFQD